MKVMLLALVLATSAFAHHEVELNSNEINLGTINTEKGKAAIKTVTFKRNEYSPRKTKVNYFVAVKRYMCVEWAEDYGPFPFRRWNYDQECIKHKTYWVKKKKKFNIEFTYTVPLERGVTETYEVKFTQKNAESKKVSYELISSDTHRVYEYNFKRNTLEAYIDAVRRMDPWW